MSYIVSCTLKLLSPKDLTHIKHILNVENGKGLQNLIRIAKRITNFLYKKLVEKKNTLTHFELNVDRYGIKEGESCEDSCSSQILAQINR